ncbi:MAG: peptide deformylase [Nitratireductor sp.]
MAIRPIIQIPDPILRQVSKPVERIDAELLKLLDSMLLTMYAAPGIGLAGIQIGEPLRVVTVDVAKRSRKEEENDGKPLRGDNDDDADDGRDPIFLINPEIVSLSDEPSLYEEGCLSIPEYYAEVERPAACVVRYLDRDGKRQELKADGLLSTCLQHEIDHLDGKLFIDHISKLKRDMVIRKFTKLAKSKPAPNRMIG